MQTRNHNALAGVMLIALLPAGVWAKTVVEWDFSKGTHGWVGNQRVESLTFSAEGLLVKSIGEDPWIEGPAVDLPADKRIRVRIRMRSNADASGQLFYGRAFTEEQSVRFRLRDDGQWHDYTLYSGHRLGPGTRFRLDPCAGEGELAVAFIRVEALGEVAPPPLQKPERPSKSKELAPPVKSGGLEFQQHAPIWGEFTLTVDGVEMAAGYSGELIGILLDDETEWLHLGNAGADFVSSGDIAFASRRRIKDSKGGQWDIERRVRPGKYEGTLQIETQVQVDEDRDVIHVPWLTLFSGLGTFGERKDQGLFAGVEYLCDEPSSSDADIAKPNHIRRVPDPVKITFPLMAIAHGGNYVGVIWEPSDMVAATFDSPDRIYNSGGNVMALSAPAVGELRFENELFAHSPFRLEANKPLKASMVIIGGKGKTVVPAVKHYVDLKGLPPLPQFEGGFAAAVNLLAHGWLDSAVNENGLFRHAVWGDHFGAGPAADAAMYIDWLANNAEDRQLQQRLEGAKQQALEKIPTGQPYSSAISHAHLPTAPFVFGRVNEFVQQSHNHALSLLADFDANGVKTYRPGSIDYSTTHFAKHANGYAGRYVVSILEAATLSADQELIKKALDLLDKQTVLYADTVPRGAQTWEVPLHTPDILASAHMVKAYVLGYIISGRQEYLEQARYWAWTGVPFVYLYPPAPGRVGLYATTPVLGATHWKAPIWIGLPVQWCGLVYASALHLLSEYDAEGLWEKIAKGITVAGLQMSWPTTDKQRQGLLPDSWNLKEQFGDGPAINPGTVQAHLSELYGKGRIYDVKRLRNRGWFIHAPCAIKDIQEDKDRLSFIVDGWGDKPYYVLISGLASEPSDVRVRRVDSPAGRSAPFKPAKQTFYPEGKYLVLELQGKSEIQL